MAAVEIPPAARRARLSTDEKISRLRRRIAIEREASRSSILVLRPRLQKVARILLRLRGVPRIAARFAPVLLPLASMVFRKNIAVKAALRAWGLARLVKGVAKAMANVRRKNPVTMVSVGPER